MLLSHQMDRRMGLCFEDVAGAVPFTTMFALLVLWFGISVRQPGHAWTTSKCRCSMWMYQVFAWYFCSCPIQHLQNLV
jgi:hypothetical protein